MRAVPLALLALAVAAAAAHARPQDSASLAEEDVPQGSDAVEEAEEERVKRWADPRGGGMRPGPRPPYRPRPRPPNPVPFPRGRRSLSEKEGEVHHDEQNEVMQEGRWKRSPDPRGNGGRPKPSPKPGVYIRPRPIPRPPFARRQRSVSEQEDDVHHDVKNEARPEELEGRWKRSADPRGARPRPRPTPRPKPAPRPLPKPRPPHRPLPRPPSPVPFPRGRRSLSEQEDEVHHDEQNEVMQEGRWKRSADPRGGGIRPGPRPPYRPRPRPPNPVPFPRGRRSLSEQDENEVMQEERLKRSADPRGNGVRPNRRPARPHPNKRPRPPRPDLPNVRPGRSLLALQDEETQEGRWKRSPDPRRPKPEIRFTPKPKTPAQPKRPRPTYPSPRPGYVNRPGRSLSEQEVDFVMHEMKQEMQEGRWKRWADPRGGGIRPGPRPPYRPRPRPPNPVPFPRGRRSLSEQEGEVHHDEQNEVKQVDLEERWKRSADPRGGGIRPGPRPPYRPRPRPPNPVPFPRGRRSLSEQEGEVHHDEQNEVKQVDLEERWKRSADPRGGGIRPGPRPPYRPRPRPPNPVPFPRGRRSLSEQEGEVHHDVQQEAKQEDVEGRWKRTPDNMPAPLPPPIIPHSAGPDPANPRSPPPGTNPRGR